MTRLAVWYMQRVTCTVRYKNWHFFLHNMTFCDILMENHALFLPSYGDFWHKNCIRRLVKGRCICENVEMPQEIQARKWHFKAETARRTEHLGELERLRSSCHALRRCAAHLSSSNRPRPRASSRVANALTLARELARGLIIRLSHVQRSADTCSSPPVTGRSRVVARGLGWAADAKTKKESVW